MRLHIHIYGPWTPTQERRCVGREPRYYQGQIIEYRPKYVRIEKRVCWFCPKEQEREVEDLRLW